MKIKLNNLKKYILFFGVRYIYEIGIFCVGVVFNVLWEME